MRIARLTPSDRTFNGTAAREPRKQQTGPQQAGGSQSLQWDRGSRAAEARTDREYDLGRRSFNGTAAREPRKLVGVVKYIVDLGLQWDRGSRAAEAQDDDLVAPVEPPSMGPRLASRGSCRPHNPRNLSDLPSQRRARTFLDASAN